MEARDLFEILVREHADSLLARLRDQYELQSELGSSLNETGPRFDHVSARLVESTVGMKGVWPASVEIWAVPRTGVVQRLELRWPTGSLPLGPRLLVFELDSERPLDDRFFEAESHLESPR